MLSKGNLILGIVLVIIFLTAIPVILHISDWMGNNKNVTSIDKENSKKAYVATLLQSRKDLLPLCPNLDLVRDHFWFPFFRIL